MANFKTHVTVGSVVGIAIATVSYTLDWTKHVYVSSLVFFTAILGSFLPDVDSDSGLPVRILFWFYGLVAGALAFYYTYEKNWHFYYIIAAPIIVFMVFVFILAPLFRKYTKHRGIFHSIPAFLISFFASLLIADLFRRLTYMEKVTIALSVSLGYLSHLVLDEIYATEFLFKKSRRRKSRRRKKFSIRKLFTRRFYIKKSFGTALDLGLESKRQAFFTYLILAVLIIMSYIRVG